MIVAVCSEKGAPGVTTLATVLSLVWPGESTILEADPSGGDLTFRLRNATTPAQEFLQTEPSVFQLAADARTGLLADDQLGRYAQPTTLGVQAIPAPLRPERFNALRPVWPAVASRAAASREVVVADLGRLQPGHTAWPIAKAATAVLLLAKPGPEGLYHLRERVAQLASQLGEEGRTRNPVAVVMLAGARQRNKVLESAEHILQAAGSPIPVVGWMAYDPAAVLLLRDTMSRSLRSSELLRSVRELTDNVRHLWPQLGGPGGGVVPMGRDRVSSPIDVRKSWP